MFTFKSFSLASISEKEFKERLIKTVKKEVASAVFSLIKSFC